MTTFQAFYSEKAFVKKTIVLPSIFGASTNFNFSHDIGVLMGARYEHTDIDGDYNSYYPSFDASYHNIVPNVTGSVLK